MDTILALINAAACGLIAMALLGAILSQRVHDGIVIKVGLSSMALGFGSIALRLADAEARYSLLGMERSLVLINAGIAVVILGYILRRAMAKHPIRRVTDWAAFEDTR
jgi:hypothetical protein